MTQGLSSKRKVATRRLALDSSFRFVPRHFAGDGDLVGSHFIAALSSMFPDGEDYFVRSVRHYRDQITDPELKGQVAGFIGQEAMHGREHRALNDRLNELGYPAKKAEQWVRRVVSWRERVSSPEINLACTAALEHFTATLAWIYLSDDSAREAFGYEAIQDLFAWHALEELEHKAVAFDVYQAVSGSEPIRVRTMRIIRFSFVLWVLGEMAVSLSGDRAAYDPRRFVTSLRRFLRTPLCSRKTWRQLKEYDRPGFHPDDLDTSVLVEHWTKALFDPEHGTLVDKLPA